METTNMKVKGRWKVAIPAGYTPEGKKITRYIYSKTKPACAEINAWKETENTKEKITK